MPDKVTKIIKLNEGLPYNTYSLSCDCEGEKGNYKMYGIFNADDKVYIKQDGKFIEKSIGQLKVNDLITDYLF